MPGNAGDEAGAPAAVNPVEDVGAGIAGAAPEAYALGALAGAASGGGSGSGEGGAVRNDVAGRGPDPVAPAGFGRPPGP